VLPRLGRAGIARRINAASEPFLKMGSGCGFASCLRVVRKRRLKKQETEKMDWL
jgi:hypothetical protein